MNDGTDGALSCTVGGREVGDGNWEYRVCTIWANCTLSLLDSQKPGGGPCTLCGKLTQMGLRCEHPMVVRHLLTAAVPDAFPKDQNGNSVIRLPQHVVIERNEEVQFEAGMGLAGSPQQSNPPGFRIRLPLVYDEPLQGPKAVRPEIQNARPRLNTDIIDQEESDGG